QLAPVPVAGGEAALLPRLPIDLSLNPPAIQGPPPAVGEHTTTILREAGCSETEIEELLRSGVCSQSS
ncbi:MAG TPA: hypothetical protein VGF16_09695, partial [Bryobacteraceae bacterium]